MTDHSALFIGFELKFVDRGPSFWKFNTTLLADHECVSKINDRIDSTKELYKDLPPDEKWEFIKKGIRDTVMNYSKEKASSKRIAISQLNDYVNAQEAVVDTLGQKDLNMLARSKEDLDELMFEQTQGILFRSKARWQMEGEKCTKYFLGLEKSRYNAKNCTQIFDANGNLETKEGSIMKIQQEFYTSLYAADPTCKFQMHGLETKKVPEDMLAAKNEQLSFQEI